MFPAHVLLEEAGLGKVYHRLIQFPVGEDSGITALLDLHDQINRVLEEVSGS
jgi:hypothetical protein